MPPSPASPSAVRPDVRAFFERYEQAGNTLDTAVLTDAFHEVFLNLDPTAAGPVSRDALIKALPMRDQMFASIGARGMELDSISETPLDGLHTLVDTTWTVHIDPQGDDVEPLTLASAFLLRRHEERWRIVLYLNHQDIASIISTRRAQRSV
jgi:hypothetical protein